MNIETRKINLINWISTIQEESVLNEVEKIQKSSIDWWDNIKAEDQRAIDEGLSQLDSGDFISRDEFRNKVKSRFKS